MNKISISLVASFFIATNLFSSQTLEPIVITSATKSEQSIKDVTSNVEVISKQDLEERHFLNIAEALNTLVGISITSSGGLGQLDSIYVRGLSSRRVLILIDGMRFNEPSNLSGSSLAQLAIDDIEKIEIVKGAQSGIWGADASGGVINIITNSSKRGFFARAKLETGSFNTQKYFLNLGNKTDKYYLNLSANRVKTKGFSAYEPKQGSANYGKRGDELGLERDGYKNNTYTLKGGVYLSSNDEINLMYKKIDARYDYDYGFDSKTFASIPDDNTLESKLKHDFKNISYIHNFSKVKVKLSGSKSKFDRTNGDYNFKSSVKEYALQSDYAYMDNSNLIFSLDKQKFDDKSSNSNYSTKAIFLSNRNKIGNFDLAQALRYDKNDKFGGKTTGKLGVKYNFNKDLYLSANYGTAYNAPLLYQLYNSFAGNENLKAEDTKAYDITFSYSGLSLTYFNTKIKDMIDYNYSTKKYANIDGTSKLNGYEVQYKKDILEDTLVSINYTRLNAKNSKGEYLARRVKSQVGFALDYYGIKNLHLNLNASYVGDRYDKTDKKGASTGNYTVWNSIVNYDINKNFKVYVKMDNIFDKYYQSVDGYATAQRSAYVGLKASF